MFPIAFIWCMISVCAKFAVVVLAAIEIRQHYNQHYNDKCDCEEFQMWHGFGAMIGSLAINLIILWLVWEAR